MQVTSIKQQNFNFEGRLIPTGKKNEKIITALAKNPEIKKLIESDFDVIAKINKRTAGKNEYHFPGEHLYRISLNVIESKSNLWNKIKQYLFNGKVRLSNGFHTEEGTLSLINTRINSKFFK